LPDFFTASYAAFRKQWFVKLFTGVACGKYIRWNSTRMYSILSKVFFLPDFFTASYAASRKQRFVELFTGVASVKCIRRKL